MSFTVNLGKVSDPNNKIVKTFTPISNHDGTLKANTSILRPTIIVRANLNNLKDCNYMIIDKFGRKYFITDIVSITSELVEITGRCDVLNTYSNQILANKAIFRKSQTLWNTYLDDGGILKLAYENQSITKFPAGFTDSSYVLLVAGR